MENIGWDFLYLTIYSETSARQNGLELDESDE